MYLELIVMLGIVFVVAVSFLIYYSTAHWSIKSSVLILALAIGSMATVYFVESLGAPIAARPPSPFLIIHHTVSPDQQIFIWAKTKERGHRLYVIPYDRKVARELEKAAKEKTRGNNTQAGIFMGTGGFRIAPGHELMPEENPTKN